MRHYNTLLNELLTHIPRYQFEKLTETYKSDLYVKSFDSWSQFVTLLYAQASGKSSLRDIQNAMAAQDSKLYHLGMTGEVRRSTLADANAHRDWRVFEGTFYKLLERCRSIAPKHKFKFKNPLYSFDSTVVDLCLAMYPWAKFRTAKGALKIHCQLDYGGNIPSFLVVTEGKRSDISVAWDEFSFLPDSINCFDRGYVDYALYRRIHEAKAFFVTRAKSDMAYRVVGQQETPENKAILSDETIELVRYPNCLLPPPPLRLIRYYDAQTHKIFEFLTNNFHLAARTIAEIYKARWQIEAFFKWIKQNLKIKSFLGTSKNAVLTQIWTAMCYYLLLAYIKYQSKYAHSLFYLHRLIRETLLDRISLIDLLSLTENRLPRIRDHDPQLSFAF
jgi:Domain of unknown function (DUF4372)/Transposase DDE domain